MYHCYDITQYWVHASELISCPRINDLRLPIIQLEIFINASTYAAPPLPVLIDSDFFLQRVCKSFLDFPGAANSCIGSEEPLWMIHTYQISNLIDPRRSKDPNRYLRFLSKISLQCFFIFVIFSFEKLRIIFWEFSSAPRDLQAYVDSKIHSWALFKV